MRKTSLAIVAAVLCSVAVVGMAADDRVAAQTLNNVALLRDVTSIAYSTNIYFTQGATLVITNLKLYADASGTTVQGLSNVTVEVAAGNSTSGTWHTATVVDPCTGGVVWVSFPMPEISTTYWQARCTDSMTNVYYYQQQMLHAQDHL